MQNVLLIGSASPSNAYISKWLQHFNPTIIIYKVGKTSRIQAIISKIKQTGFFYSTGIKLTSICLILERIIERISGEALWPKISNCKPGFHGLKSEIHNCNSEQDIYPFLKKADCVVLLDGFRFNEKFYRICKRPVLQIIDGIAPNYMGNAGIFWAYAIGDYNNVGKSVILRKSNFSKFKIAATAHIRTARRETIRSLQVRGTMVVAQILGSVIERYLNNELTAYPVEKYNLYSSPAIFDYIRAIYSQKKLKQIPDYAKRN